MIMHHTRGGRPVEILAVLPEPTIYGESIIALVHARGDDGSFVATYDAEGRYGGLKDGPKSLDLAPLPEGDGFKPIGAAAVSLVDKLRTFFHEAGVGYAGRKAIGEVRKLLDGADR